MPNVSVLLGRDVFYKSEADCGAWGGNKVRKLEVILARARGHKRLVTYGAGTSSWCAALALHAVPRGFEVVLGLGGAIPDDYRELYGRLKVRTHTLPSYSLLPFAAAKAVIAAGPRALPLPAGGSGRWGDLGSIGAGGEIATAVQAGEMPFPAKVYVPSGTTGTAAGVAVGLAYGGLRIPVVAVRVTPRPYGTAALARWHARRVARVTRGEHAPIAGDARFFGPAYGKSNPASTEAHEIALKDGIDCDPTYAAKAFAALVSDSRAGEKGPVLFLHTSPGPLPPEPTHVGSGDGPR